MYMYIALMAEIQALFQDAKEYIQILNACRTIQVAQWRPNDLKRAVNWGVYFENVYTKVNTLKPNVSDRFNTKLMALGQSQMTNVILIDERVQNFDLQFLQHNVEYLIETLLENPYFSPELRKNLISEEVVLKRTKIKQYCEKVTRNASMTERLMDIQSSFLTNPSTCLLPVTGVTIVNSVALLEELNTSIDGEKNAKMSFDDVIQRVVTSSNGMEILLATLYMSGNTNNTAQLKLLEWFAVNLTKYFQPITSLPYTLLAVLSEQHSQFYDIYVKELTTVTDNCNTDSTIGTMDTVTSYNNLVPLWLSLCTTRVRDKTITIVKLQALRFECLKMSDRKCLWMNLLQHIK